MLTVVNGLDQVNSNTPEGGQTGPAEAAKQGRNAEGARGEEQTSGAESLDSNAAPLGTQGPSQ